MSELRQYIQELKTVVEKFDEIRIEIALKAAFYATDTVVERVRVERLNDVGLHFGVYADSTWKRKKKKSTSRFINFSDENIMLNTTKPQVFDKSKDFVVISIQPRDPQRLEVMGYQEERFGKIILLSEEEQQEIADFYEEEFREFLNSL